MPPYPVDWLLRYGTHPEQLADVRVPARGQARALVLLVHGGFWRDQWDRHHTDVLAADLAERGYVVASLEYRRLGGAGGWPQTFDDVAAGMDALPGLVAAAVRDTGHAPVVAMGHSAGGQLVLWDAGRHQLPAGSRWHRSGASSIRGVVALAPVADLACARELGLDDGVVTELLGAGTDGQRRQADLDPSGLPPAAPVVVVHGDRDRQVPLEVSQQYVHAVRARGADVAVDIITGADHFALIEPGSSAWPRVLAALERVLVGS